MNFSLVVAAGASAGKEIPIRLPQFVIGRDPDCQLRPASALISKKHCAFIIRPDKVIFKDFGSTNGSFVNDVRIEGEVELSNGDIVKFGPLCFRAKLEPSAQMQALSKGPERVPAQVAARAITSNAQTAKKSAAAEDDIAAMLFNFADAPNSNVNPDNIPMGTTIAGLNVDPTVMDQPAAPSDADSGSGEKKNVQKVKVQDHGSTSKAAQAILDKYMRRPR
jgi:predicted component of type VI protein secretion system